MLMPGMHEPFASDLTEAPLGEPAFDLQGARDPATPVIFASPHSGRVYPADLMEASVLGSDAIRRSEDALVDALLDRALEFGASLMTARYARAYIDVNRDANELDPAMFADEVPPFACAETPRVAAGLGAIARIVAEGQEIYGRKLLFEEARRRIDRIHRPYHHALAALLAQTKARFGVAVLIDWHSMPSIAARHARGARASDFVLGDRFGASCAPALVGFVERELRSLGYQTARNAPYAGGYTTELYGAPGAGVHVLQIEIDRSLYLDEAQMTAHAGFARLKLDLEQLCARLTGAWARLV